MRRPVADCGRKLAQLSCVIFMLLKVRTWSLKQVYHRIMAGGLNSKALPCTSPTRGLMDSPAVLTVSVPVWEAEGVLGLIL